MVRPVVICHQLGSPENLASIARVMANFGCSELILSAPRTSDFRSADRMAVHAEGVLDSMVVVPTLDEALKGVVYAIGSTSRDQIRRQTPFSPETAAQKFAQHAGLGKVALVLGGERRGLSDDDLSRCHDVVVIPTDDAQPSMNLSHAAAVLLYLCTRPEAPPPAAEPGAQLQLVQKLEVLMKDTLLHAEFLNPQASQHTLMELTRSLVRGGLTEREAQVWISAFTHVKRWLKPAP